jgi:hypothetical protein
MTKEQLDTIRARLDAANTHAMSTQIEIDRDGTTRWINLGPFLCSSHDDAYRVRCLVTLMHHAPTDLRILLDEVERLTSDLAMARQVSGELCEACGWDMKFPGEPCRCELLKWRDEWEAFKAHTMERGTSSFARGAEAMRTALVQRVSWGSDLADRIRDEPVPEDKP